MSTASSSAPSTEAKRPSVLSHSDYPRTESGPRSDSGYPDSRTATASFTADVEVLVPPKSLPGSLPDPQTTRFDEAPFHTVEPSTAQVDPSLRSDTPPRSNTATAQVLDPVVTSDSVDGTIYLAIKRGTDIVLSAIILILLSPLLLLAALLVKLTDGGSAFYPHIRVGEGGNEFTCYKFRSMVVNAEKMKAELAFFNTHDDQKTFKIPNDPRVTAIGRLMRRTSIDELPQLWNILKGDMSIVGPRPPVVSEVEQYSLDDMQRLTVKPGLTCIWQVSGRSKLPFPEQLKMDLDYIENRDLLLDLKLIALTIPAVLSADGAY